MKKQIIKIIITLLIMGAYYYVVLPPLNPSSIAFWTFIIMGIIVYLVLTSITGIVDTIKKYEINGYKNLSDINNIKIENKVTKILVLSIGIIIIGMIGVNIFFSPLFNANDYANRISVDETISFSENISEVDFNKIPLLDKESSQKLGDRKMGEIPELVSQFTVSSLYTQINYQEEILRVTPLEYDGLIKYFTNRDEGVKAYITVDSVTGEAKLTELEEGMKYMPSAMFSEDLNRKLRFEYPTEIFGTKTFEIDEEGNPYWVVPTVKYVGVNMRSSIDGVILLDAVTGKSKKYDIDEIPSWVDHVYPSELILEQVNNWGSYVNGFWNSIFGQKNVVNTTEGYNYLTIEDDVYLYTGITSVLADESNLGFILVNLRTKQTNYYSVAGAEEFSAMNSAQGLVQEKGYIASFPLLINLAGRPTYLMSLKDAAGLVKMYAFVDVIDYQLVSVTDSSLGIVKASEDYISKISSETINEDNVITKDITVDFITSAIIDGNTYYYITDSEGANYQMSITVDEYRLPFIKNGMQINIEYTEGTINIIKGIN